MTSVLFLTVDCLRSDHVGAYGYDRPTTPNIDELASVGTRYKYGYANCPGTRYAFQLLHTGRYAHQIAGLGIPEEIDPLARHFRRAGFETGGFAVNGFISRDYGYDTGFDTYYSIHEKNVKKHGLFYEAGKFLYDTIGSETLNETVLRPIYEYLDDSDQSEDDDSHHRPPHTDEDTVKRATEFVKSQQAEGSDYFCWVHFMDAHTPYGYWPDELEAVRGDAHVEHTVHPGKEGLVREGEEPPDRVIDTYDACIRRVDQLVGRLLEVVDDETVVVLTGDHGETFGRYAKFHSGSMYSTKTWVPIIVRDPSLSGGTEKTPAQHVDLPPTLLNAAGLKVPDSWEGTPLHDGDRDPDAPIFFSYDEENAAVRTDEWKYISAYDEEALYRAGHYERETENVLDEHPDVASGFASDLDAFLKSSNEFRGVPNLKEGSEDLSAEVEENLRDLGYL